MTRLTERCHFAVRTEIRHKAFDVKQGLFAWVFEVTLFEQLMKVNLMLS